MRTPAALIPALTAALMLASCAEEPAGQDGEAGAGLPDGAPTGQAEQTLATAPDPTGEQLDHEEMREALDTRVFGSITDTDDYWERIRDLNTELQRLAVDPNDCKPYVTASALPVPSSALAAFAEDDQQHTAIYTFPDADAAQAYMDNEQRGAGQCGEHTVTRELDSAQIEATTEIDEVEVLSAADASLGVRQEVSDADGAEHAIGVVLRHQAQVVAVSRSLSEPLDGEEAEESAVELEAEAAAILEDLTGADLEPPEPEPEEDEGEEGE
ncbi:hypothetical protein [Nesterenkonia populi]